MTYANDNNQRSRDTTAFDSNSIKSALYGGLNVSSSPLSIPTEDTPDLQNVITNDRGNIQVREGTRIVSYLNIQDQAGCILLSYNTRFGKDVLFIKNGTDLGIYLYDGTNYVLALVKADVWPDIARNVKPDYVITNEPITRIIFTCGVAAPVQITLAEQGEVTEVVQGEAVFSKLDVFNLDNNAFNKDTVLFIDDVYTVPTGFDETTSTVTVPVSDGSHLLQALHITWQWWTPAINLLGNQVYNINFRYHVTPSDASVSIPAELLIDMESNAPNSYPIRAYKDTPSSPYTFTPNTPTGVDEYAFSYGITRDSSNEIPPGFTHITFGDADIANNTDSIETISFVRGYKLFSDSVSENDLYVMVDGEEWSQYGGTPADNKYILRNQDYSIASNDGAYITFDGEPSWNIPSLADIFIVYRRLGDGISSQANTNVSLTDTFLKDGQPYPVFGLHEHCDYDKGVFPRAITVYANRLVLAGFPNNPMKVVLSNILDYITPGRYYANYQMKLDANYPSGPIDLSISIETTRGQPIVAAAEFAYNLFVFTPVSCVRVPGSGSGNISASDATIISMGSLGAFNPQCVARAENMLVFFGTQGVSAIVPVAEIGGFTTRDLSIKVKSLLSSSDKESFNSQVAWIDYSPVDLRLMVGASDDLNAVTASKLFTYSFTYKSWSRFAFLNGATNTVQGIYVHKANNIDEPLLLISQYHIGQKVEDETCVLASQKYFLPMDYVETRKASELPQDNSFSLYARALLVRHITTRLIRKYRTNVQATNQLTGFTMNPDPNIEDVSVFIDGVEIKYNEGFYKVDSTTIYIQYPMNDGQELVIRYNELGVLPVAVFEDNYRLQQGRDYDVIIDNNDRYVVSLFGEYNPEAIITVGFYVQAYWTTPVFVRQTLFNTKLLKNLAVFVRNPNEVYDETDINEASSQPLDSILSTYKVSADIFVSVLAEGVYSSMYGDRMVRWDDGMFDVDSSIGQAADYQALTTPLLGRLKHFQVRFWSTGVYSWEMVSYQIEASMSNKDARRNVRGM